MSFKESPGYCGLSHPSREPSYPIVITWYFPDLLAKREHSLLLHPIQTASPENRVDTPLVLCP